MSAAMLVIVALELVMAIEGAGAILARRIAQDVKRR